MLRLSRHLTTALLWLAIALLPLRSGLALAMPHAMGTGPVHAAGQPAEVPATDAMSASCDESAGHDGSHAADAEHAVSHHTCSLCTLCHSAAAVVTATALHVATLPPGAPPVHASRDIVGAVFDAPDRPPRLFA